MRRRRPTDGRRGYLEVLGDLRDRALEAASLDPPRHHLRGGERTVVTGGAAHELTARALGTGDRSCGVATAAQLDPPPFAFQNLLFARKRPCTQALGRPQE